MCAASDPYFQRYLDAMRKLQAIVMNPSLEREPGHRVGASVRELNL